MPSPRSPIRKSARIAALPSLPRVAPIAPVAPGSAAFADDELSEYFSDDELSEYFSDDELSEYLSRHELSTGVPMAISPLTASPVVVTGSAAGLKRKAFDFTHGIPPKDMTEDQFKDYKQRDRVRSLHAEAVNKGLWSSPLPDEMYKPTLGTFPPVFHYLKVRLNALIKHKGKDIWDDDLTLEHVMAKTGPGVECPTCTAISSPGAYLTLDRIIPGAQGGRYTIPNTRGMCWHCNRIKWTCTDAETREYVLFVSSRRAEIELL